MTEAPLIRLADYQPPAWSIHHVKLGFELDPDLTLVRARLSLRQTDGRSEPLRLHGEDLELRQIVLDGEPLARDDYRFEAGVLEIPSARGHCMLETLVAIVPRSNTRLEGLYVSGPMLLTQCEAEGFRRITFFIDQPDVLATFDVELRADKQRYPVLLSNGNPLKCEDLAEGRHVARWNDPHPKPAYLFAIAAGDIDCVSAPFTTAEGRAVTVNIWAERGDVPRCQYALEATLRAMRWDEQRFARCYDLDVFNIVATQHFTMGAMENKGLNIFNARYILADAQTATDADYEAIESVIAHEYLHNWSGNRVTLRDWFQLSLKEGLTVFRDQEFTSDLRSRGVKRISDVRNLRARQFVEDAGPLAHPVRPPAYREINNFYTMTVYEKGAELIRMIHTLIGEPSFREGLNLYFQRNDGRAATVEDLLGALGEAAGRDLTDFLRWYDQAGTPRLQLRDEYDAATGTWRLQIRQHTPATPGQADKQPLRMPLAWRLYDDHGQPLAVTAEADCAQAPGMLELHAAEHSVCVHGLASRPLPAFLHGLSAPVKLEYPYRASELAMLARCERDPVIRWDSMQRLAIEALVHAHADATEALVEACGSLLEERDSDPALIAECLALPDLTTLADAAEIIDVDSLFRRREDLLDLLAETHADLLQTRYVELAACAPDSLAPAAAAARRLKNLLLPWLCRLDPAASLAAEQFHAAQTLTDRLAALNTLVHADAPAAAAALAGFRARWVDDPLMTDKWIGVVASRPDPSAIESIRTLLDDSVVWQPTNPNRVRALLGTFARSNLLALHRADGAGYALCGEQIVLLDRLNPQVAARLLTAFEPWQRLPEPRRSMLQSMIEQVRDQAASADVLDVAGRLLA